MSQIECSDEELVNRYLGGCQESFEQLVQRYETKVFNTALYLTSDVRRAEEILQQVFLALIARINDDFGKTPLFDWVLQHTLDLSVESLIGAKNNNSDLPSSITLSEPFEEHSRSFSTRNAELRTILHTAACNLDEEKKHIFILRDILGVSTQRTAELLATDVFSIRSKLHNARLDIAAELERVLEQKAA